MCQSKLLKFPWKGCAIVKIESAPTNVLRFMLIYLQNIYNLNILPYSDKAVIQFSDLVHSVKIPIQQGTTPTSCSQLQVNYCRYDWEDNNMAPSWETIVGRLRPYLPHEAEPHQSLVHILLRAFLRVAMSFHHQGPMMPRLNFPASFRANSYLPDYLHFPLYPLVAQPPRCSSNSPMHLHRRLIIRIDREAPYYAVRRAAQLPGRRGPPHGRRCCRRLRYTG